MSKDFSFDPLGTRMKEYEHVTRFFLPRRSYVVIRVDGMAFHTLTKAFKKPFDPNFVNAMNQTAVYLCKNIMGAQFAFVQSDEISIVLTDFAKIGTEAWFGNCIQKMCGGSAAKATSEFNRQMLIAKITDNLEDGDADVLNAEDILEWLQIFKVGEFDSRVYQIPQRTEVINYFVWRQQDTVRNSISSVANSLYSSKELHCKNVSEQQEMIFQKGINWNDFDPGLKRGRLIRKITENERSIWSITPAPEFTKEDGKALFREILKENELEPAEAT